MITALALFGAWLGGAATLASAAADPLRADGADAVRLLDVRQAEQSVGVRIWLEEGTDLFYPGDAVRVRFRTDEDAFVAILHLDPEGYVDLLFPRTTLDQHFVRGRRTHSLPTRLDRLALGRTPGIGYLYVIASAYPLDLRALGARPGSRGDAWGLATLVRGDPFWALEELTRTIVRDWRFTPYAVDVFSYHVGGRHRYPGFACYDAFGRRDVGSHAFYPSCDRLRRLLVTYPYYYDTRRYRGDRTLYLRELDDLAPRHGFKEPPVRAAPPLRPADPRDPRVTRPEVRGRGEAPPVAPERQERQEARPEPAAPARQRPTLERREAPREAERAEPRPPRESAPPRAAPERSAPEPRERAPQRAEPPPREQPRQSPPPRETVRPEPQRSAEPPPRAAIDPAG
jgi:hypothetical protein